MRRLAVWTVLMTTLGAFTILPARPASAECRLDEGTGITSCRLYVQPVRDRATPVGDGRTSSFVWWSTLWYNAGLNPFEITDNADCRRDTVDGATTTSTYGNYYLVQLRRADGAPVTDARAVCVFDGADPQLAPPPPPPTEAEFVEAARKALTVQTSLSPRPEIGGLTGLDTWLWCEDPGTVSVGVSLRGWTAEASMQAVEFSWAVGGTASAGFLAPGCGSEPAPAATWMPETKGPYSVTLTSTWAGTWVLSYNGFQGGSFPLGPVEFAAPSVPYPVSEYRGRLTSPGGGT